jgi:galactokinase
MSKPMHESSQPTFADLFGAPPETQAHAPGRVNLIGEHTDYHGGFVLPSVVPQHTTVELRARGDRRVRGRTTAASEGAVEYELGSETPGRGWIDYVQGVTQALRLRGFEIAGVDFRVDSTVPLGSGLSSSAALEVSTLRALRSRFGLALDDLELARAAHAAETAFVGAPVGIMDQFISSLGQPDSALLIDTRAQTYETIPLPRSMDLVVLNSGIVHQHAGGQYGVRRRESFDAAARLGVERLRELSLVDLPRVNALPPPLNRRARHVVTENDRVLRAAEALREGRLADLGRLLNASHVSMRDDYEVSTSEIDELVAIAQNTPDVFGARLTGGGFGGCIVAIAASGAGLAAATKVLDRYNLGLNRTGTRLLPVTSV